MSSGALRRMPRRAKFVATALMGLSVLVSGCGSGNNPEPESGTAAVSPRATLESPNGDCALISDSELAALGDGPMKPAQDLQLFGVPACTWLGADTIVSVATGPSGQWASKGLADEFATLDEAGALTDLDSANSLRRVIASGPEVFEDEEACQLFSMLLEAQGLRPGQHSSIAILPNVENPTVVTGQGCLYGQFAAVSLSKTQGVTHPHLARDRVARALREVLARS